MRHSDKTVMITGGARGIGFGCVQKFIAEGARVVILDRDTSPVRDFAAAHEGRVATLECDLSVLSAETAAQVFTQAEAAMGRVNCLVNNAGIIRFSSFMDSSPEDLDLMMAVNLRAPMILSQEFARRLIAAGVPGSIVNMSSLTAEIVAPEGTSYAASKGAMRQMTRGMALELIRHNIRVNAVGPGTIETEMSAGLKDNAPHLYQMILSRTPAGRLGRPEEIAGGVSFLASDDASYMVGQTLYFDGGRLVMNLLAPTGEAEA